MRGWKSNHKDEEYNFTPRKMVDKFFDSQYFNDWKMGVALNLDRNFLLWITMPPPPWPRRSFGPWSPF